MSVSRTRRARRLAFAVLAPLLLVATLRTSAFANGNQYAVGCETGRPPGPQNVAVFLVKLFPESTTTLPAEELVPAITVAQIQDDFMGLDGFDAQLQAASGGQYSINTVTVPPASSQPTQWPFKAYGWFGLGSDYNTRIMNWDLISTPSALGNPAPDRLLTVGDAQSNSLRVYCRGIGSSGKGTGCKMVPLAPDVTESALMNYYFAAPPDRSGFGFHNFNKLGTVNDLIVVFDGVESFERQSGQRPVIVSSGPDHLVQRALDGESPETIFYGVIAPLADHCISWAAVTSDHYLSHKQDFFDLLLRANYGIGAPANPETLPDYLPYLVSAPTAVVDEPLDFYYGARNLGAPLADPRAKVLLRACLDLDEAACDAGQASGNGRILKEASFADGKLAKSSGFKKLRVKVADVGWHRIVVCVNAAPVVGSAIDEQRSYDNCVRSDVQITSAPVPVADKIVLSNLGVTATRKKSGTPEQYYDLRLPLFLLSNLGTDLSAATFTVQAQVGDSVNPWTDLSTKALKKVKGTKFLRAKLKAQYPSTDPAFNARIRVCFTSAETITSPEDWSRPGNLPIDSVCDTDWWLAE